MTAPTFLDEIALSEQERFTAEKKAEESLCGAVLRRGEVYEQVRDVVEPVDFRVEKLRWLWKAFESLHQQGLKIDQFSAADELQRMGKLDEFTDGNWNGRMYLSILWDRADARNAATYARNVKDYANKRTIANFITRWSYWANNGRRDADIVKGIMDDLAKLTIPGAQDEYTASLKEALSEAYDWSVAAAQGNLRGVKTGFVDLDKLLKSMFAENLYIVAARPGIGKTAFLLTIALHAAKEQGKKVLIFSLEMSKEQVAQRLISQISGIDLERIISSEEMEPHDWEKLDDAIEQLENLGIIINDLSEINIRQIRQTARKIAAEHGGIDLVIVDYLQLAESDEPSKYESRVQEVSKVSRGLKYLARELEVPVLAAAQLNREVEKRADKRPVLADLRESGQLEQDAFAVMFLYKPDPDHQPNVIAVDLAKHRNGKVGMVELVFRGENTKFVNAVRRTFNSNQ